MDLDSEFKMRAEHALNALAEAQHRLHGEQFWLASVKCRAVTGDLAAMISTLKAVNELVTDATLIIDALAEEKRKAGEQARMKQALKEGGVEEIEICGGASDG